jgi:hypothetical protein
MVRPKECKNGVPSWLLRENKEIYASFGVARMRVLFRVSERGSATERIP